MWKIVSYLLTVKMFLTLELNSDINQINMLYYTYNCFVVVYKCNFCYNMLVGLVIWFMVFNATFNNISIISWQSVLLVEENGGHGKKDLRQTFVHLAKPTTSMVIGTDSICRCKSNHHTIMAMTVPVTICQLNV
jgi:hypothetical protein